MKTLHLPLKSQWYSMIHIGVKKEEYREIKPYWITRMFEYSDGSTIPSDVANIWANYPNILSFRLGQGLVRFKQYTNVCFSYGYTKRTMTYAIESIRIGLGNPAWGAPAKDVIIIKLNNKIQES